MDANGGTGRLAPVGRALVGLAQPAGPVRTACRVVRGCRVARVGRREQAADQVLGCRRWRVGRVPGCRGAIPFGLVDRPDLTVDRVGPAAGRMGRAGR